MFLGFAILSVLSSGAYSSIQVPQTMVRALGKDAVFQLNSTNEIVDVRWGIADHRGRYNTLIFTDGEMINPNLAKDHKGRVSFIGNLTAGHAWFKISNLTLADTNYYGIELRVRGDVERFFLVYLQVIDVMPHFVKVPTKILYVQLGEAVTFEWDYISGNKTTDLDPRSPRWEVYNSANGWQTIGADYSALGWQWKLSPSCPERLQNPTRVSKALTASLVIYNVTIEDSGIYRCNLTLRYRPPITSTTRLIVTAQPQFTSPPSPRVSVTEHSDIKLSCTAVGPPTPSVTWVRVQGVTRVTVAHGVGNVALKIGNIKRDQNGTYECQAVNNPNQKPVSFQTTINVMYPPRIDHSRSDSVIKSLRYAPNRLHCAASGFPPPNITWYNSIEEPILQNVTSFPGFSEVSIKVEIEQDYARYKCRAANLLGYTEHNLTVIVNKYDVKCDKISERGTINFASSPAFIVCIAIIIMSITVNVICLFLIIKFCHKRSGKNKENNESIHQGLNMSAIPDQGPFSHGHHSSVSNNSTVTEERAETVYDQPVDEPTSPDAGHVVTYPYEIPVIPTVVDGHISSTGHYQNLNVLQQTARDYQSLQGVRPAASSLSEVENTYEPLKETKKSQYEQLNRM